MSNYNRVLLMGNLTRGIELKQLADSQFVANFGLAVNRKDKTKSGESREEVCFIDCEAWGRTAEVMSQHLAKGEPVFIEGRLKLDQWDDRETGKLRSKLKVAVERFEFVGSRSESKPPASSPPAASHGVAEKDIPF